MCLAWCHIVKAGDTLDEYINIEIYIGHPRSLGQCTINIFRLSYKIQTSPHVLTPNCAATMSFFTKSTGQVNNRVQISSNSQDTDNQRPQNLNNSAKTHRGMSSHLIM